MFPVGFGEQDQVWNGRPGFGPEFLRGRFCIAKEGLPDSGENIVQKQHGHITADTVTMAGDGFQTRQLCRAQLRLKMI